MDIIDKCLLINKGEEVDYFQTRKGKGIVKIHLRTKKKRIKKKMHKELFGNLFDEY